MHTKVFFLIIAIVCAALWAFGYFVMNLPALIHVLGLVAVIAFLFMISVRRKRGPDDFPYTDIWP